MAAGRLGALSWNFSITQGPQTRYVVVGQWRLRGQSVLWLLAFGA
jgi:hypothetical protein